jgi:predicted DsbA family dithiol-disulfide isomerase
MVLQTAPVALGQQVSPQADCSGSVAAIVARREISLDEIDRAIAKQLQPLEEKIFQLRRQALENLISRVLLEREASRAGTTIDQVLKRLMEVETAVSEQKVTEIFQENEVALTSMGEHEAKSRIRLDLESQTRIAALRRGIDNLRVNSDVNVCLVPPAGPRLEIDDAGPSRGAQTAPVTIYEYSDFQCPYCKQARATVEKVLAANEGKVRLVFKHLPLPIHPRAFPAAQASYCAHEQGRFWQFHDRLFDSADLSDERLMRFAVDSSLDLNAFARCLNSEASQNAVLKDMQEARRSGFSGTPTFVVNGTILRGAPGATEFQRLIEVELKKERRNK